MDHVEWRERPELHSPVLVCAFKGWNDAGEAASAALGFLVESFDARVAGTEHDLLMLQGVEPSLRWREYTGMVIALARELGVRMIVTLGALLADVPHTRPVPMT